MRCVTKGSWPATSGLISDFGNGKKQHRRVPRADEGAIGELTGFLNRERTAASSSQPNGLPDELLTHAAKVR